MNEEEIRKKTIFIIVLVITYILLLSNSIYAFNADDNTWVGCPIKKENEGDKIKFTLERDAIEKDGDNAGIDLEVKAGQIVILDLNGHKLQNYSEGCSTINIFPGGNLTIVDNSGGKQGEILQKNGSTGLSTIYNAGTLNIEAGKITQTEQVNNIAVINNASNAELNIKEGTTIKGSKEVIANFGKATISGGNIEEENDFYAIRNSGIMEISGGIIKSLSSNTSIIGNIGNANSKLTISSNPTIEGKTSGVVNYNGLITVNGGTFNNNDVADVYLKGGSASLKNETQVSYDKDKLVVVVDSVYYIDSQGDPDNGIPVSKDATNKIEKVKQTSNAKIKVLQGDLTIEGAAEGFTVENTGEGKVSVNNTEILKDSSYTVHKVAVENPVGSNNSGAPAPAIQGGEKDNTPKTGAADIVCYVVAITAFSIMGIVILINKSKKF